MRNSVIVQARMNSKRLPGKVMKLLAGRTVLDHVLTRCRAVSGVDVVCCATTDQAIDDVVAIEAKRVGAVVFRGSEDDVIRRYFAAAQMIDADVILRVTADCPLIDPGICEEVLTIRANENAHFADNNATPTFPHGLDCEAFTIGLLKQANDEATMLDDREHVSPWMRRRSNIRRTTLRNPDGDASAHRWTLDYPEDYEFFEVLFKKMSSRGLSARWTDILQVLHDWPEIAAINAGRVVHAPVG